MAAKNIQELAENFIKTSSEEDFIELCRRIKPGLLNYCRSILNEKEDAEDAVSNTIFKIWTKAYQYNQEKGNFSTWIYNIARNESLVIRKNKNRYLPIIQEIIKNNDDAGEAIRFINFPKYDEPYYVPLDKEEIDIDDLYQSVLEKMKKLPDIYKEILYDREILRMKYQEIADKYGMKRRAVATRIRRARLKIREMFPGINLVFND